MHKSERLQTAGWDKHKWKGSQQAASLFLHCNREFHKEPFQHRDKTTQHLACCTATDFVFTLLQGFKKGVVTWEGTVSQKAQILCPQKCTASNSTLTITWHSVPPHLAGMILESSTLQNKHWGCLGGLCSPPTPLHAHTLQLRQTVQIHAPCLLRTKPMERSTAQEGCTRTTLCRQPASDWCFPHRKN